MCWYMNICVCYEMLRNGLIQKSLLTPHFCRWFWSLYFVLFPSCCYSGDTMTICDRQLNNRIERFISKPNAKRTTGAADEQDVFTIVNKYKSMSIMMKEREWQRQIFYSISHKHAAIGIVPNTLSFDCSQPNSVGNCTRGIPQGSKKVLHSLLSIHCISNRRASRRVCNCAYSTLLFLVYLVKQNRNQYFSSVVVSICGFRCRCFS